MEQCRLNLFKQMFCHLINKLEKRLLEKVFILLKTKKKKRKTKPELKARGEKEVKVCGSQVN